MSPNTSNRKLSFWDIFFLEIVKIISDEASRFDREAVTGNNFAQKGKAP